MLDVLIYLQSFSPAALIEIYLLKGAYLENGVASERRAPGQQLECKHAQRPPVYPLAVALSANHFDRRVLRSPDDAVSIKST
jgi:hypothetical protein